MNPDKVQVVVTVRDILGFMAMVMLFVAIFVTTALDWLIAWRNQRARRRDHDQ